MQRRYCVFLWIFFFECAIMGTESLDFRIDGIGEIRRAQACRNSYTEKEKNEMYYAAVFESESCWGREQYIFEGESAEDLIAGLEHVLDLSFLTGMDRGKEKWSGRRTLGKLESLMGKRSDGRLTVDDVRRLNVKFSMGSVRCVTLMEGINAKFTLMERYPKAIYREHYYF